MGKADHPPFFFCLGNLLQIAFFREYGAVEPNFGHLFPSLRNRIAKLMGC